MIQLIEKNGIEKTDVIVESNHADLLLPFKKEGFLSSYYLPQNLNEMEVSEQVIYLARIEEKLKYNLTYISTNYKDYNFIARRFPNKKKLFWFTHYGSMSKIKARLLLYKIQNDDSVDVLLIPYD